jgi:uncharacterized protein (UPF0261 family)
VPERYRDRHLYRHNDAITLMRIDATEAERVGRYLARKLNAATGPVSVFIPASGFSALSVPGAVFHDPQADAALVAGLLAELDEGIEVRRSPHGINEAGFAIAMAERLDALMQPARDTVA